MGKATEVEKSAKTEVVNLTDQMTDWREDDAKHREKLSQCEKDLAEFTKKAKDLALDKSQLMENVQMLFRQKREMSGEV